MSPFNNVSFILTNGCDHCAGEEEGLSEAPRGDAGAVAKDGDPAVVGPDNLHHEVLQIIGCV